MAERDRAAIGIHVGRVFGDEVHGGREEAAHVGVRTCRRYQGDGTDGARCGSHATMKSAQTSDRCAASVSAAGKSAAAGPALAQYVVPLAFHVRWYFRVNLREIYHLCELRTTPQGHPDYRWVAQEMFRLVSQVHPRLARYARFVDMGPGDELERRRSERRMDEKLSALDRQK